MEIFDFVKLIHKGEITDWMRKHKLNEHPCPPEKLLRGRPCVCMYCVDCTKYAMSKVKAYKNHYQVGKIKITKEELDG